MKKLVIILALTLLCINQANLNPTFAVQTEEEINEKLANIGFGKLFAIEPEDQVKKFFNEYEKAGNKHNLNKVRTFYDENYISSDGFDLKTYFEMIEKTWNSYPDLKYNYEIKKITVNGDWATVQTYETAKGTTKESSEFLADKGLLESDAEMIYYLQKSGKQWVITSDYTIFEKTYLRYGDAKDIAFDIIAPYTMVAGKDYSVLFAADVPKSKLMLGSITNEKITYPAERPKEIFRKLDENSTLERFVKANTEGYNEQATVAVGITSPEFSKEELSLKLNVSGVAFLISRVNVIQPKNYQTKPLMDGEKGGKN